MEPCILENFLAKHDMEQAVAAKRADNARDVRLANAQAETNAARTRAAMPGAGGQAEEEHSLAHEELSLAF